MAQEIIKCTAYEQGRNLKGSSFRLGYEAGRSEAVAKERKRVWGIISAENYKLEEWYSSSERPDTLTHFEANQRNMKTRNKIQDLLSSLGKPFIDKE